MQLGLLFRIIRQRFWLVMTILALTVLTATIASFSLRKVYTASSTLFVDIKSIDPVTGTSIYPAQSVQNYLTTQVSVITSRSIAIEAVESLKILDDAKVMTDWRASGGVGGREQLRDAVVDDLLSQIKVEASREGTTIAITYDSDNPEYAAKVVNAFARAYILGALGLATDPVKQYAKEFESQAEAYRARLAAAQEKLSQFQQASGILASDEKLDVENQRLSELTTQLVALEAAAADGRSRTRNIRQGGRGAIPEVVQNPLIQTLQAELGRAEAQAQELATRLGGSHPQLIALTTQVQSLRDRLAIETRRVTDSVVSSANINDSNVDALRKKIDDQRAKVLELKQGRNQIAALQRDVENAQKAYDLVSSRFTQTDLESKARQSNVSIITEATVPTEPSRPKPKLNIAIATFLGGLIGVLAALALEATQKPLRGADDLIKAVGVPVLAVIPPASSQRTQRLVGSTGSTGVPPPPNLRLN